MNTPRSKKPILIAVGVALMLMIVILVTVSAVTSRTSSPILPTGFLGYTNDARGSRLAIFTVTNVLSRQIDYSVIVELKEMNAWRQFEPLRPPTVSIAPHQASTFTVLNPIEGNWRVALVYWKTPTKLDELGFSIRRFFDSLKLYSVAKRVPTEKFKSYTVYGPEMID